MKVFLQGILIGIANIVPGFSGGTMAVILGVYDRLIYAIHSYCWIPYRNVLIPFF